MKIEVIKAKCTGCTLCVRECPVEAIRMLDEKAVIDLDTCILCGACEKVCPVDAILFEKPTRHSKEDLSLYRDVWVFSEQRGGKLADVALELVGEGKKLAKARGSKLCAVLLGHNVSGLARELAFHGAERVYVVDSPRLERFSDESYSQAMVWLIERHRPEIVLAGATAMGRSFIPRVAAEIRTGLTADCTSLGIDAKGNLIQTRPAFGGNIMATILCTKSRPQMATVRPKVMKKPARDEGLSAEIVIEVPGDEILASRQSVIDEIVDAAKGPSLQAAEIIVAGGAGLKK
jgi:electron transfer flavoprotein alpha subunit